MDLFCNDKYWNRLEDNKNTPQILKPEHKKSKAGNFNNSGAMVPQMVDEPAQDLIRQWGDCDFKFKLWAQGGMVNPNDP